jgi:hypothetical protein
MERKKRTRGGKEDFFFLSFFLSFHLFVLSRAQGGRFDLFSSADPARKEKIGRGAGRDSLPGRGREKTR